MKRTIVLTITEDMQELRALLSTLGVEVVKEFLQKRKHPHKGSYFGPGKIDEILEEVSALDVDCVIVNGDLKPSQHHFLEMMFQKEFIDRSGVILRIFADHAHTQEAIAQVTLAKLRYELPFLREWIHKAKSGDRPGFLAGGAYATDVYYEHAKTHARKIEKNLSDLSKQRKLLREKRRETGYALVSLAGYTNAGKSALMNKMCESSVLVDDKLFSTLSTTTRKIKGIRGNVLMSDTVGFIRHLPPDLVKAFNPTLEEVFFADLILLLFDTSDDDDAVQMKLRTSLEILTPKTSNKSVIIVGNKIDLVTEERRRVVKELCYHIAGAYPLVFISAGTGEGLDTLREHIQGVQNLSSVVEAVLALENRSFSLLSRLRSLCNVVEQVSGNRLHVSIRCRPEDSGKIMGWLTAIGGKVISEQLQTQNKEEVGNRASNGNKGAPLA